MDAITRQALGVARSLVKTDFDGLHQAERAAWARYARPALRDLVRYLDDIEADEDGDCPGSGTLVYEDRVDGNGITTCPKCKRYRLAYRAPGHAGLYRVSRHGDPAKEVA